MWKPRPFLYRPACSTNMYYLLAAVGVSVFNSALSFLNPLPTQLRASFSDHSPHAQGARFFFFFQGNPVFILTRIGKGVGDRSLQQRSLLEGFRRQRDLPKVKELEGGSAQAVPQVSLSQSPPGFFTPTSPARCALRAQTPRAQSAMLRPVVVFLRRTAPWLRETLGDAEVHQPTCSGLRVAPTLASPGTSAGWPGIRALSRSPLSKPRAGGIPRRAGGLGARLGGGNGV